MTDDRDRPSASGAAALVVRRTIKAGAERLFEAWTRPEQLMVWWGPRPVRCAGATIDLRVGGHYRIENELPDGRRLTIEGVFTLVERPSKLAYTWTAHPGGQESELVTVQFDAKGPSLTEVVVIHERITSPLIRDSHQEGWRGCLDGLSRYFSIPEA